MILFEWEKENLKKKKKCIYLIFLFEIKENMKWHDCDCKWETKTTSYWLWLVVDGWAAEPGSAKLTNSAAFVKSGKPKRRRIDCAWKWMAEPRSTKLNECERWCVMVNGATDP